MQAILDGPPGFEFGALDRADYRLTLYIILWYVHPEVAQRGDRTMTYRMSAGDVDKFCSKLEKFSEGLSDTERTLFKSILNSEGLQHSLELAHGGVSDEGIDFRSLAPRLDASFFRVLSW